MLWKQIFPSATQTPFNTKFQEANWAHENTGPQRMSIIITAASRSNYSHNIITDEILGISDC
jgi:hypothetical protein